MDFSWYLDSSAAYRDLHCSSTPSPSYPNYPQVCYWPYPPTKYAKDHSQTAAQTSFSQSRSRKWVAGTFWFCNRLHLGEPCRISRLRCRIRRQSYSLERKPPSWLCKPVPSWPDLWPSCFIVALLSCWRTSHCRRRTRRCCFERRFSDTFSPSLLAIS